MTDYRLVLAQRASSGLGANVVNNVQTRGFPMGEQAAFSWGHILNGAGTLEFSLPIDGTGVTPANFYPGRELHLYRNAGSEVLVWAGHLWNIQVDAPWVRFLGMGWYEYLRHRQIRADFYRSHVEQLDVAWDMINYAQGITNGNIGITRASAVGSGVTRSLLYCAEEAQYIADALEELAGADTGFDFQITPNKAWTTYYPQRGTDRTATVTLDAATNLTGLSYSVDGTQIENDVAGIGPVEECEPIHFKSQTDGTSQTTYGLMQGAITRSKLGRDPDLIDALALEQLQTNKDPRKQPAVTLHSEVTAPSPVTGEFDIGDDITLTAAWGFATFSNPFRCLGYRVNVDRVGRETVDLTLDAA